MLLGILNWLRGLRPSSIRATAESPWSGDGEDVGPAQSSRMSAD